MQYIIDTIEILNKLFDNSFVNMVTGAVIACFVTYSNDKRRYAIEKEEKQQSKLLDIKAELTMNLSHLSRVVQDMSNDLGLLYDIRNGKLDDTIRDDIMANLQKQHEEYEHSKENLRCTIEKYSIYIPENNIVNRLRIPIYIFEIYYGLLVKFQGDLNSFQYIAIIPDELNHVQVPDSNFFDIYKKDGLTKLPSQIEKIIKDIHNGNITVAFPTNIK